MKTVLVILVAMAVAACAPPRGKAGLNGADGLAGSSAVLSIVDPCGDGPGYDEVLLVLADGTILAYFESGDYRHLAVIGQGNYRTTDEQACAFSVSGKPAVITWDGM